MRVLVCGGRMWGRALYSDTEDRKRQALAERAATFKVLGNLDVIVGIDVIIHGDARGADRLAERWANHNCVPVERYPANWHELGRKAGPLRNSVMVVEGKPDLAVAFPGGVGTADMVGKLRDADVEILDMQGLIPGGFAE